MVKGQVKESEESVNECERVFVHAFETTHFPRTN